MAVKQSVPSESADLERREARLTLFACSAIVVMAVGLAVFMYPAVFSGPARSGNRTPQIAFWGFCGLTALLVVYIVERQITIRRLRVQMALDRREAISAREEASRDLLKTIPTFNGFQDCLPMEYRRAAATGQALSLLVAMVNLREEYTPPAAAESILGDAAKAISRKLRHEDSIYLVRPCCFGVVLPGMSASAARGISDRIAESLTDVAGANERFSFTIAVINYPEDASTAHGLEAAVRALLPDEDVKLGLQTTVRA